MAKSDLPEPQGWDLTFGQFFEGWILPEIERRASASTLPTDFSLYMAQVLFPPDGKPLIFLNEEVRGEALMRATRPLAEGEPVMLRDLEHVERFELPDEFLDNGHFTIIRAGESWRIFFNFLSGRAKAKDMLLLAKQFLEAAAVCAGKGYNGPAVDNLYSAAELASKSELILRRSKAANSKKHGPIASEINAWAKLGNIDVAFVALFNKLGQQRPNARYSDNGRRPPTPSQDDLDLVEAIIERGLQLVSKATDRDTNVLTAHTSRS